ncbi:hypothetical protein PWG71_27940 [Nocardiopsis sp. N85]|uniref:hypothetical protein n=1 Tax=Nocardiopsis sp. N85 TaxID=3029400 RepID=UPI00237F69BF|nr:hypothetical protein [Nocardiopsis sp. N85]MDE3725229.1 hypothetical protein [Nocardiopsis sp. N85]
MSPVHSDTLNARRDRAVSRLATRSFINQDTELMQQTQMLASLPVGAFETPTITWGPYQITVDGEKTIASLDIGLHRIEDLLRCRYGLTDDEIKTTLTEGQVILHSHKTAGEARRRAAKEAEDARHERWVATGRI